MPYIDKYHRITIDQHLDEIVKCIHSHDNAQWDGDLNYAMSYLVAKTFAPCGKWRYHFIARALGAFEAAKLEFYRRVAGPYEDKAIAKNGDIQPYANANELKG